MGARQLWYGPSVTEILPDAPEGSGVGDPSNLLALSLRFKKTTHLRDTSKGSPHLPSSALLVPHEPVGASQNLPTESACQVTLGRLEVENPGMLDGAAADLE
jgi:hypothetical protein